MAKTGWISSTNSVIFMKSKKPKKQRKAFHTKPLHKKRKQIKAHLNEKLSKELNTRNFSLRKGDTVKIMRGDFKGKNGKVTRVNTEKRQVFIEKISRKKADGTDSMVPLNSSNLLIESLNRGDEKRFKRKTTLKKKTKKKKKEKKEKSKKKKSKKEKKSKGKKTEKEEK